MNRIKRELSGQRPAIGAHDMLAAEFTRLRELPAFHLDNYMSGSNYSTLLQQVVEASRIPAACIAALAYWGEEQTHHWWMPELERFARPFARPSGMDMLLNLPLVAGSTMLYAAGAAAILAQRFDLLMKLFGLRGHRIGQQDASIAEVLRPDGLSNRGTAPHYQEVADVVGEGLGLGTEPVDEAIQLFDVLRLSAAIMADERFPASVEDYATKSRALEAMSQVDQNAKYQAWVDLQRVIGSVARFCRAHFIHAIASERTYVQGESRRWGCPLAERLAGDVQRARNQHPLVTEGGVDADALWLALKGASVAIGRVGDELQTQATPVGHAGFVPDSFWLDTGRPPEGG